MSETYRLEYLTGRRLRAFLAAADEIVPPEGEGSGGGTMETAGMVDWALNRMPPDLRKKFLAFILVVEFLGVFFGGRTFSRNSREARQRQLAWMEGGPVRLFRMGFFGLKNYVCMGYYTREDVWAEMEYDGPVEASRTYPDQRIRALSRGEMKVVS